VRPPEIVFPKAALGIVDPDWDMRGDIWSLACTVSRPNSIKSLPDHVLWIDIRDRIRVHPILRHEHRIGKDGKNSRTPPVGVELSQILANKKYAQVRGTLSLGMC
jgi:hypothetical protein